MASTSASAAFYADFRALKDEVTTALDTPSLAAATGALGRLRTALAAARADLPAYDQRSYDLQAKDLEARLAALRADNKPKAKFSFAKRTGSGSATPRTTTPSPAPPPPRATSTPSVPANTYTITSHTNAHLTPPPDASGSYTLTLEHLTNCVVDLRSATTLTSLHARAVAACIILAPATLAGSAMLSDVSGSVVVLGAQQLRLHNAKDTVVCMRVGSLPVIEGSTGVFVGGYPGDDALELNYTRVQDFDWVRGGASPNWRVMKAEEVGVVERAIEVATSGPEATALGAVQSIPFIQ